MATNIELLPLCKATAGVGLDEDWIFSLAFVLPDNVTPINLTGITLTVSVFTEYGTLFTGPSVISGTGNNVATLTVLAAAKATWEPGVYWLEMVATDGVNTKDILALSTLTVGAPQIVTITLLAGGSNVVSVGGGNVNTAALAAALAALPRSQLVILTNAIVAAMPNVENAEAIPAAPKPFVNGSGFLVTSQALT